MSTLSDAENCRRKCLMKQLGLLCRKEKDKALEVMVERADDW